MNVRNMVTGTESDKFNIVSAMRTLLILLPAMLLVACASTGGKSGGPTAKRAIERWDALLAQDWDSAYEYYSPGYRSSQTRGDFELNMRLRKVRFTNAEYEEQDCTENVCTLKFKVFYTIASPVPGIDTWNGNTSMDEKWINTDGQWWYFPED